MVHRGLRIANWGRYGVLTAVLTTLFATLLASGGCVSRKRVIPESERLLPAKTMTRAEAVEKLTERSRAIQTFRAAVTLHFSSGAMKSGGTSFNDYREVDGVVLLERPNRIQIQGDVPVVGTSLFEMVSDGSEFRVWIPPKNKFYVGESQAPPTSDNPVLNLRPANITEALLVDIVPYMNDSNIRSSWKEMTQGQRSYYVLEFFNAASNEAQIIEEIWIDRSTLEVARKLVFAADGKVNADIDFSEYDDAGPIRYPRVITIHRPVEDYTLTMMFKNPTLNAALSPDAFQLNRPPGAELVQLGRGSGF